LLPSRRSGRLWLSARLALLLQLRTRMHMRLLQRQKQLLLQHRKNMLLRQLLRHLRLRPVPQLLRPYPRLRLLPLLLLQRA